MKTLSLFLLFLESSIVVNCVWSLTLSSSIWSAKAGKMLFCYCVRETIGRELWKEIEINGLWQTDSYCKVQFALDAKIIIIGMWHGRRLDGLTVDAVLVHIIRSRIRLKETRQHIWTAPNPD